MYKERIKVIIRQADSSTKQDTLPKGVGVAKFNFTKTFRSQLIFSYERVYIINTRLQITVKVFYSPKS